MIAYARELTAPRRLRDFIDTAFRPGAALPFSFTYGGTPSGSLTGGWRFERTESGICFTAPDGLKAAAEIRAFEDFPAVEWLLTFENTGASDSLRIGEVRALDVHVETAPFRTAGTQQYGALDNILYYNGGSDCKADDFLPCSEILHHISDREEMRFSSSRGRPTSGSHGAFPYFNLQTLDRGVFFALGWSGQWDLTLLTRQRETPEAPQAFRIAGGMSGVSTVLHPGEKIRTARALLMFWDGSVQDSFDQSRRFMLKYHTPRTGGKPAVLPLSLSAWGNDARKNLADIDAWTRSGLKGADTYWIDAGWYGPSGTHCDDPLNEDWSRYVGWYDEDPARYPDGLGAVGDAAHAAGLRFLLWIEPDRAAPRTKTRLEHPEFYLPAGEDESAMFNLGDEDAYEWMLAMLSDRIERFHLDVLRIDYNLGPLDGWRANDAEDRRGMTEIRAVTNFYRLWDTLLERFPHLLIDNCASGGRRLDFEACSRSVPLFRTDYFCYADCGPAGIQVQTAGLAPFVPLSGSVWQAGGPDTDEDTRWYLLLSSLAAGLSLSAEIPKRCLEDAAYRGEVQRMLDVVCRWRTLARGDFRMLTSVSIDERDWYAYELSDAERGVGCVFSARRARCAVEQARYELRFIRAGETYRLTDAQSGGSRTVAGEELLRGGLCVTLDRPQRASLIFVEKL